MSGAALSLAPIERTTLNELAYERLRRSLLSGRIEPNRLLTLRGLARELGTSMMPVREAVARLCAEQAFEVVPNRGIRIPLLSPREWDEIWELRLDLEGEAAARAAAGATPAEVEEIAHLRDSVREAVESALLHETLDRNSDFQLAIYRAARTRVLIRFVETLRMQSVPHCTAAIRVLVEQRPPYYAQTLENHDALAAAIAAGDAEKARSVKRRDLVGLRALADEVAHSAHADPS